MVNLFIELARIFLAPKIYFHETNQKLSKTWLWIIGSISIFVLLSYVFLFGQFDQSFNFFRKDTLTTTLTTITLVLISIIFPHLNTFLTSMGLNMQNFNEGTPLFAGKIKDIFEDDYKGIPHSELFFIMTSS